MCDKAVRQEETTDLEDGLEQAVASTMQQVGQVGHSGVALVAMLPQYIDAVLSGAVLSGAVLSAAAALSVWCSVIQIVDQARRHLPSSLRKRRRACRQNCGP